jgi:hypothetical protein
MRQHLRAPATPVIVLVLLLLMAGVPADLWASTTVPPPFDFINGLIAYIRRAAVPTIVLALMVGALAWLFARNGEGIVQWAGKAFVVLAIILGGGTLLASIGFEGAVL